MLDYDDDYGEDTDWEDPDWQEYDDDDDFIDEWLDMEQSDEEDADIRIGWRLRLNIARWRIHDAWFRLKWALHPNRLRRCPVCKTRGHTRFHDGVCTGCWIPF